MVAASSASCSAEKLQARPLTCDLDASKDIVDTMLRHQGETLPRPDYLATVQGSTIVQWMREMVVQFMNELGEDFQMRTDTVGLAMHYFDRVLSSMRVDKGDVQLYAVACVLVAAKFAEKRMPALADLEYVCQEKYSIDRIKAAETTVLTQLDWELHAGTPHMFATHLLTVVLRGHAADVAYHYERAEFYVNISYYVYETLRYTPCLVGAAAIACASGADDEFAYDGLDVLVAGLPAQGAPHPAFTVDALCKACDFDSDDLAACINLLRTYVRDKYIPRARASRGASADDAGQASPSAQVPTPLAGAGPGLHVDKSATEDVASDDRHSPNSIEEVASAAMNRNAHETRSAFAPISDGAHTAA